MKTILLLFFNLLITAALFGQHAFFTHVATPDNIFGNSSYLDHPLLNGNPDAIFIVSHRYDIGIPNGAIFNNNITGTYYQDGEWIIYNENFTPMVENSGYNIYVESGNQAFVHIADIASQGGFPGETILDHPLLNGNPGATPVITNTWIGVNNNKNYGVWYNGTINRWLIYSENLLTITENTAFFVVAGENKNQDVIGFSYEAAPEDIIFEYIEINHPLLNDNPNALFVITHNWGLQGDSSNIIINSVHSILYSEDTNRWYIGRENGTEAVAGSKFNIMMDNSTLSTNTQNKIVTTVYPNPATDMLTIQTEVIIDSIEIYNAIGQQVLSKKVNAIEATINVVNITNGVYFIKIVSGDKTSIHQFIKK